MGAVEKQDLVNICGRAFTMWPAVLNTGVIIPLIDPPWIIDLLVTP